MTYDFIVIGGGIVGLSTGMALLDQFPNSNLLVVEKEDQVASHQTGRNSGVIHSGIYYKPGSLKAQFAREGSEKLINYCKEHGINYDICGKIIVATTEDELPLLDNLYERALQNGLDVTEIDQKGIREIEPHSNGLKAISVNKTGITDYVQVSQSFVNTIQDNGGEILCGTKVNDIKEKDNEIELHTNNGVFHTNFLVNCAGLFSDRIAQLSGVSPGIKIIPFKGEYYKLKEEKSHLVKNLIYPVPNPEFPFLGVHLTRMMNGEIHAGPNAVLSLKREGYNKIDFNFKDTFDTITYPAFWKIARKNLRYGLAEMVRYASKKQFLKALQRLVPDIELDDLVPTQAGIRAQALTKDGKLIDDFIILKSKRSVHVCNAPSPAATASLSIGEYIANYVKESKVLV